MGDIYILMILTIIISPISGLLLLLISLVHRRFSKVRVDITVLLAGTVLVLVGIITKHASSLIVLSKAILSQIEPIRELFHLHETSITTMMKIWLLSDPFTIGLAMTCLSLCLVITHNGAAEQMMYREMKRLDARRKWTKDIDYLYDRNTGIFGVSGSGKGTLLTKIIEQCLEQEHDTYFLVVDGKSDCTDPYGFYHTMRHLCRKYDRELAIINGTALELPEEYTYDPFDGLVAAEEVRDMIMTLMFSPDTETNAGSEHYRMMFSRLLLQTILLMQKYKVRMTMTNISRLLIKDNMEMLLDDKKRNVSVADREEMKKVISTCYADASAGIRKLEMFLMGSGKRMFQIRDDHPTVNARTAYQNNQLLLFLISEMDMPEFSSGIGRLAVTDARMMIAARMNGSIDKHRKARIIMDEYSAYASSNILSILSRARSSESVAYLSTQSVSDLTAISPEFRDACFDNISRFFFYRQNSPEAAETVASLIGTRSTVQETLRSSAALSMGEASNRLVREFVVSPDEIKGLPNQHGIMLDKMKNPPEIKWIENTFVDMKEG